MKSVDLVQGSPEWLAWRSTRMTGSVAAAVIGWDPYKTPYRLWCEMTLRIPAFAGNKYTEAGTAMEPKARAAYEILHDLEMAPVCLEHEKYPGEIGASLDGLSIDETISLEIKHPSEKSHAMAVAGQVPRHYIPQCQHGMMCKQAIKECHYWSYRESGALVIVKSDPQFQEQLLVAELAFLDLVKADIPPAITYDDVKVIDKNPAIEAICQEILERHNRIKEPVTMVDGVFPLKRNSKSPAIEQLKARAIELAGHPKMKCGSVQISVVNRNGKFSYHKLTISEGA